MNESKLPYLYSVWRMIQPTLTKWRRGVLYEAKDSARKASPALDPGKLGASAWSGNGKVKHLRGTTLH